MNARNAPAKQASNRHVVDQLADVRAQIKALETREADLKTQVSKQMGSADSLGGDEFIALQVLSTRKGGIDDKKLAAAGINIDDYRKPDVTVLSIRIERRDLEAA